MKRNFISTVSKAVILVCAMALIFGGLAFAGNEAAQMKVNINEATVKELSQLPGIGKKRAEDIVTIRSEKGKFKSVNDLRKVNGIGKKTFEKIEGLITTEGG